MSSRVTILAAGTRGDMQPYVALAHGLLDAGHDVTLAANAEFLRRERVATTVARLGDAIAGPPRRVAV